MAHRIVAGAIVIGLAIVFASSTIAQEPKKSPTAKFKKQHLPAIYFRSASEIPEPLMEAIKGHCRLPEDRLLERSPVTLVRRHPWFAIVPCRGSYAIFTSVFVFDRDIKKPPTPEKLIVIRRPGELIATDRWPGAHSWDEENEVLTGVTIDDVFAQTQLRYHYRRRTGDDFILFKIEMRRLASSSEYETVPWQPYWDVPEWKGIR